MAVLQPESNNIHAGRDNNFKVEVNNNYWPPISEPLLRAPTPNGTRVLWTPSGYAPQILLLACQRGDLDGVKEVINSGYVDNINCADSDNKTALHLATEAGCTDIIKFLLSRPGVKVNKKDRYGHTAFILAFKKGYNGILELLLEQPDLIPDPVGDECQKGETALLWASSRGYTEVVKLLLNRRRPGLDTSEKNAHGNTPLALASKSGYIDIVRLLLVHNIDVDAPDVDGNTAILLASEYGHVEIVRLLLISSCKYPNIQDNFGNTPLMKSCRGGHTEVVKLFLLKIEAITIMMKNKNGETALIIASMKGYAGIVRLLLLHGHAELTSIINIQNKNGDTALLMASALGHTNVVKLLLECKSIAADMKNKKGKTALMVALSKGHVAVASLLGDCVPVQNECKALSDVVLKRQEAELPPVSQVIGAGDPKLIKRAPQQLVDSAYQPDHLGCISMNVVSQNMSKCLAIVMDWQKVKFPSRLVIGGGDLRKLTIWVREQPVNFMIIIRQSVLIASNGQNACRAGCQATRVLLGEENSNHSEWDRTRFTEKTLAEIKESASNLYKYTNDIRCKFRLLRTGVLELHKEINVVTSKRDQADFFVRLSRQLNRNVQIGEGVLEKLCQDLEPIENTLNIITQWWQKVESEANYLQMNGISSLVDERNTITLKEIKHGFVSLKKCFDNYIEQMGMIYDHNISNLSEKSRIYLTSIEKSRSTELKMSNTGRLELTQP